MTFIMEWWFIFHLYYSNQIKLDLKSIRGYSYVSELAWLGGMTHLGEIIPSLKKSYKIIVWSYQKWASPSTSDWLDFAGEFH